MKFFTAMAMVLMALGSGPVAAAAWDVGPAVGSRAPALHVTDRHGAPVAFRKLSGKSGLVLVFFRSAKWCPYCQKQLMDFKDAPPPLAQRGYTLAALSYDPPAVLENFTTLRQIPYPLLSDPGSMTIDAWKLRDIRYQRDSFAWGVPYASIFVISPDGVILAKLAEEDYKRRPSVSSVLGVIDGLAHSAGMPSTKSH